MASAVWPIASVARNGQRSVHSTWTASPLGNDADNLSTHAWIATPMVSALAGTDAVEFGRAVGVVRWYSNVDIDTSLLAQLTVTEVLGRIRPSD